MLATSKRRPVGAAPVRTTTRPARRSTASTKKLLPATHKALAKALEDEAKSYQAQIAALEKRARASCQPGAGDISPRSRARSDDVDELAAINGDEDLDPDFAGEDEDALDYDDPIARRPRARSSPPAAPQRRGARPLQGSHPLAGAAWAARPRAPARATHSDPFNKEAARHEHHDPHQGQRAAPPMSDEERAERRRQEQELTERAVAQLRSTTGWQNWVKVRSQIGCRRYSVP